MGRAREFEVVQDLLAEFYTPEQALVWLFSPHELLKGARPADSIREDRADDVFALIDHLRSGAFI